MAKIKVGDPLFIIENYERPYGRDEKKFHAVVTKVGRRYLEATEAGCEGRFQRHWTLGVATLAGKDVNDHSRAWASEAEYEAFEAAKGAWGILCDTIQWKRREPPHGVTTDDIHAAMRLLKIEVK